MKKRNVCTHTGAKREESRKRMRDREGERKKGLKKQNEKNRRQREGERKREYRTFRMLLMKKVNYSDKNVR